MATPATTSSSLYANIRNKVDASGVDQRVEVNQRALIDKILARYASAGAVYRELLQNSNDAEAKMAEIYFATSNGGNDSVVTEVRYRNNGIPFRPQDWSRLQKIAEGNPDVSKVGAFGVGAYTMFSICEEPLVISGDQALAFVWKGDALWCKVAPADNSKSRQWTTFCLPSRDPYPLPDFVEFGRFLCASLTFTQCLKQIVVYVNDRKKLIITKETLQEPQFVEPPKSTAWWKNDGAVTTTPKGVLTLKNGIWESKQVVKVEIDGQQATTLARYVTGKAITRIPPDMARRMQRVTKKQPPKEVSIQILLGGQQNQQQQQGKGAAQAITSSFAPAAGKGRIFIGFRTSQTTGLGAHLAAPLIPTVEREAIDLQDPTLRVYNTELLEMGGIILRLTLEHSLYEVGVSWLANKKEREALEQTLLKQAKQEEDRKKPSPQEEAKHAEKTAEEAKNKSTGSSLFAFAKFMAKGVTKQIVNVIQTTFAEDTLLKPRDPLPLTTDERLAILLMQSFCPQPSTPDLLVGTSLAQGFSRCLTHSAPPVLTRSGVVRGDQGRLPNSGMEQFIRQKIIRTLVYENAKEYHDLLAGSRRLTLDDLMEALSNQDPMTQEQAVTLVQWWFKYLNMESRQASRGEQLKEVVEFVDRNKKTVPLDSFLFYTDFKKIPESLPFPETVLPQTIQKEIGNRILVSQQPQQYPWFMELPVHVWAQFISEHRIMTAAQPEDEAARLLAWKTLGQAWLQKNGTERVQFGSLLSRLFAEKKCLPFDSSEPVPWAAERPKELYLNSAELHAFDKINNSSFQKVSNSLEVTEEFLLALGVRKSVSIDFLFANLETLRWSDDPKPLVEYLRSASLTSADMEKLSSTQYLSAEVDDSRTFAPKELYFPSADLRIFPFLKLLQWPDDLTPKSANGKFLQKLGVKVHPPLTQLLRYVSRQNLDSEIRKRCLAYLVKNLGPNGTYEREYSRMRVSTLLEYPFLPTQWQDVMELNKPPTKAQQAPPSVFSDPGCMVMGFSVLDPELEGRNSNIYGARFRCPQEPDADALVVQFTTLVASAKFKLSSSSVQPKLSAHVVDAFQKIFAYLSSRSNEFSKSTLGSLKNIEFIPSLSKDGNTVEWYKVDDVFFRRGDGGGDSLTEDLFRVIDFSSFLAAAGVKTDPTNQDLFRLLLTDPEKVLKTLGSEEKYKKLLRRIAANPPFRKVTPFMQQKPFLLAYKVVEQENGEEKQTYQLARASDIYIIDNSFYGRMFPVIRAPQESDLENFYFALGSNYISKKVQTRFEIIGSQMATDTKLTKVLSDRIQERRPLLVSPSVTSRPLVPKAGSILDKDKLVVHEVANLKAVYSLGNTVRNQRITCCSKPLGRTQNGLYVTPKFDWFDVGYAIGGLILQRCQLEDAFFIGSLLDAPVEQLRARGFPVDRILIQPEPAPKPALPPVIPPSIAAPGRSEPPLNTPTVASLPGSGSMKPKTPPSAATNPVAPPPAAPAPPPPGASDGGKDAILKQMFPDCDEDYIFNRLGPNPNIDDVRSLAEEMAEGKYPKRQPSMTERKNDKKSDDDDDASKGTVDTEALDAMSSAGSSMAGSLPETNEETKRKFGKRFGKALSGIRNNLGGVSMPSSGGRVRARPGPNRPFGNESDSNKISSPEQDAASHLGMEDMLKQSVNQSAKVNARGIKSNDTLLTDIPEGISREGDGCEVLPGQSLKPFNGPYRSGKAHNGIRVFSARAHPSSEQFLTENFHAVDLFADVLQHLCGVYGLDLSSVAIYHDPSGGTIAFNAQRALHFNVRFFFALHYSRHLHSSRACYSYWYTTMAHELAHHLVSAHNKEHGFYTESYVTAFLPKFVSVLTQLETRPPRNLAASKFTK